MRKNRQQRVRVEQPASHEKITKPANGIYVDGVLLKAEDPLPEVRFPSSLQLLESRVILNERVMIVLPYTRRSLDWLLAQANQWCDKVFEDEQRQRVLELLEAVEAHYSRWQPR